LLLGGAIGAVVGGVGAYLGFDKLASTKVLGKSLADEYIEVGVSKNKNFPYIILSRAIYYASLLKNLSHAKRDTIHINIDESFTNRWLNESNKKVFEKLHQAIQKQKTITPEIEQDYTDSICEVIKKL